MQHRIDMHGIGVQSLLPILCVVAPRINILFTYFCIIETREEYLILLRSEEQNIAQSSALASLADSLVGFAGRLKRRAAMVADFARLNDQARRIAGQAYDLRTSRWGFVDNASRLADSVQVLATQAALAAKAAGDILALDASVAETLTAHAARICTIIEDSPAASRAASVRAELTPLEAVMVGLKNRVETERSLADEAAALARQASGLAQLAEGLRGGGRSAERAASDVHQALLGFVEDAGTIAVRVTRSSAALADDVDAMAATAQNALARRAGVVPHNQALVWSAG